MRNFGIGSWLERRFQRSGTKTALVDGERMLTYAQLRDRSARIATALDAAGVQQCDRVALLGENSADFVTVLFGTELLGAVFVPLNTRLAPGEIAFQLEDSGAKILLHDPALMQVAAAAVGNLGTSVPLWTLGESQEGSLSLDEQIKDTQPWTEDQDVSQDDLAVILYTSGTTGKPKGACLTHGNLTWNAFNVLVDFDVASPDVSLQISPMFHVASLGMGVLPVLLKGATLVVEPKFIPARTLELIEKHGVTWLAGVPTTYQLLTEDPAWETTDISTVSKMTCGGSAVPLRVIEAYEARGLRFTNCYGMTETSPGVTTLPPDRSREKAGSSGISEFWTDFRIVDPMGDAAPVGEPGEILVAGPNVISRYWNRPDAAGSWEAGWFRTGDMGYTDDDGFLYISDRIKDMIISGGENVYPAEVEAAMLRMPAVQSVAVVGVPHEKWGEVPHAVVVLHDGAGSVTAAHVEEFLDGKLARYKVPKTLTIVEELPRTASGKIRKNVLREQLGG
ncbi:o-succinylbenzoate--CoA ligase [Kocuria sp.]|uniref:o-succinylbenzoate--CoA ligase n=1 Tax=Kocuria sp. TaxID=1871328 RepID=UPI0026E03799|nr:o-succinylbenzoate--CoA ligase [Kocuria sp.]MDO5619148.1 o-succinylbenzoate--CoA ligase [Kocuria sp.]